MITSQLINPKSIVVVGGSSDITKPGGKILKNIIDGGFKGSLYVTNLKEAEVQGIRSYQNPNDLPLVDLAVIAIAARFVPDTVELLARSKGTRAFIVLSAGFSEESEEGANLENRLVEIVNGVGGSLIGPNCVGILTPYHQSIFTYPIPKLDPKGCDFVSGSGATACFIMEAGIPNGLSFANVFSVGNSAQVGVEEILKHLDETFDPETSSKVKLLYLENIDKPQMLLKHASSLARKGCKIAAIKSGSSEAGSRAASSHTGALASPDVAVDALFKKAGIVRCHSREELLAVASVFMHPTLKGKNIAIITHAGGPAVMLTDALSIGGLEVPLIEGEASQELLAQLFSGSSVANPIDFLATGTASQLGVIIDYVENKFDKIDGMVVIFGTPGLFPVFNVYDVLHEKMKQCKKPIFPVLPSTLTAAAEVKDFISKGRINFPDEVVLGRALSKVLLSPQTEQEVIELPPVDTGRIRSVIENSPNGYLEPSQVQLLLSSAGIEGAAEAVVKTEQELMEAAERLGFPIAMKVVGPVHKSDVGGVVLGVDNILVAKEEFERMLKIKDTHSILLQPMISGIELFVGAKREDKFGHLILCGMGGIFIEVLKDVSSGLAPISKQRALEMIRSLRSHAIIKGVRGKEGVNEEKFSEILRKLSALLSVAPEIFEMDLNPLLGTEKQIIAVDARIRIEK